MHDSWDVIVIGAGAAGLFAATEAAQSGLRTLLLEKNRRAGVKILASGGTRCNVTSTLPIDAVGAAFGVRASRFLKHSLHALGPQDVRDMLAAEGVPTEDHPFEKVFPTSGRAADVLAALLRRLERAGACLAVGEPAREIRRDDTGAFTVETTSRRLAARRVIVTSGGRSYPRTGTTGDGYAWLERLGHGLTERRPALVPLRVNMPAFAGLAGIAVEDAVVRAVDEAGRTKMERHRPVLFTHRGLSGPGPMDVSRHLNDPGAPARLIVDWLPRVAADTIEHDLMAPDLGSSTLGRCLSRALPRRLAEAICEHAGVDIDRRLAQLTRTGRLAVTAALKNCRIAVSGDEGYDKAEVTAGGVRLDEIDPRTMQSRLVAGLFIAGEILDVDGPIGGFNFQAAFSTGMAAGRSVAGSLK